MRLRQLFEDNDKISDLEIRGINTDSHLISQDEIFVAIKGAEQDGHKFIKDAIEKGAVCVVKQKNNLLPKDLDTKKVIFINVNDTRRVLSKIAAEFYHQPSHKLKVIGVTGTNGKTTVTYLIESILEDAGYPTGLLGTIDYKFSKIIIPSVNTTPGPLEIQAFLSKMVKEKLKYCVMEVSSHSLDQDRVRDINFRSAIFTNLTQDHLDYHHNLNDYFMTKAKLFRYLSSDSWAVLNNDDPHTFKLTKVTKAKKMKFGFSVSSDIKAKNLKLKMGGSEFQVVTPKGNINIETSLMGRHNVYNILAAIALGVVEDIDFNKIKKGVERLNYVPGRLEAINEGQRFNVFVDYAHTEDALKNVITSLREFNKGKIIVVFGCGGERDITKRPKMGKVVSTLADYFIITNDNPRNENPSQIIKDIAKGIKTKNFDVIQDRCKAIEKAIRLADDNDTVLIAGKGHEAYQIFKNKILPFDDRQVAREILRCLK